MYVKHEKVIEEEVKEKFQQKIYCCWFSRLRIFAISCALNSLYCLSNVLHVASYRAVFLNRRTAARYRALASIIPGHERPE